MRDTDSRNVRVRYIVRGIRKGNKSAKVFHTTLNYREATTVANQLGSMEANKGDYYKFHISEVVEYY